MNLFGWWRAKKIKLPIKKIEVPKHESVANHSADAVKESEQKLNDAAKSKREATQIINANDQFVETLQRSMRRSHG